MKFNGKDITELLAINRRNFIKFMIGGAAGTALTPIPWKLADDVAIFTQNLPWVPVPAEGEFIHEKTVCKLCPGGCGIEVRKVGERAVKIEGRTDYPVNPGGICPQGAGGLQLLYNENIRFPGPMKRVGPRGSGEFIRISWDEAIDTLAKRIVMLRDQGKIHTLAAVDGNQSGSTASQMIERLLTAAGSPNYLRIQSAEDTYRVAGMLMQGNNGPMAFDLENSDYILSFGCGLLEGWGSSGRVLNAWSSWRPEPGKRTAKVVQVESRASNTASKADRWVAAKPGTETALALGIACVIISERLYDNEFIENYSFGFHDWVDHQGRRRMGFKSMVLERYSPRKVSGITGIGADDIVSLARDFAGARAPVAICGKGKGMMNGSLYEFMSILALNALMGRINRPGGILLHDAIPFEDLPDFSMDSIATIGLNKSRLDMAGTPRFPFSGSLMRNFAEAIIEEKEPPVDTLMLFSANPAFTQPDGGAFYRAMKKIPFIVSFNPYRDESSNMADLILPDHHYLEKMDDVVWPSTLQFPLVGIISPVVKRVYDTKNSGDVIIMVAKRISDSVGSAFPWNSYEDVLRMRFKGLFNSKNGGFFYRTDHTYEDYGRIFKTETGRFEFFCKKIESAAQKSSLLDFGISVQDDEAYMPHYEPPGGEDEIRRYPLRLLPYEIINLSSGWLPSPPHVYKTIFDDQLNKKESFIQINPLTAKDYSLSQGDRITLETRAGKATARVDIFEGAMPGVVYVPLGFGHEAYDDFSKNKGINPNFLIEGGRDPLSGDPVWWDTPVKIGSF